MEENNEEYVFAKLAGKLRRFRTVYSCDERSFFIHEKDAQEAFVRTGIPYIISEMDITESDFWPGEGITRYETYAEYKLRT